MGQEVGDDVCEERGWVEVLDDELGGLGNFGVDATAGLDAVGKLRKDLNNQLSQFSNKSQILKNAHDVGPVLPNECHGNLHDISGNHKWLTHAITPLLSHILVEDAGSEAE